MRISFLAICLALATLGFSRDQEAWKAEKDIKKQFEVMKENLKFYGGYYLLTEEQLQDYYKSVEDSSKELKALIAIDRATIAQQKSEIDKLSKQLTEVQANLDASLSREDSIMSFWGQTSKTTFATVMYTIVFVLIAVAAFVFLLFVRSNKITVEARAKFDELEAEFESQKKRSLDKEMKLNRELQTERNKNNMAKV